MRRMFLGIRTIKRIWGFLPNPGFPESWSKKQRSSAYHCIYYVSADTLREASLVVAHATDGEEENHFYALNSALSAGRIGDFYLRHLWKKTIVFLHNFDPSRTDRRFLYVCYGNPYTRCTGEWNGKLHVAGAIPRLALERRRPAIFYHLSVPPPEQLLKFLQFFGEALSLHMMSWSLTRMGVLLQG
jgi:hypothetical protein